MVLDDRETLKELFGPTEECLPVEQIAAWRENRDAVTQAHLASCTYCASQQAAYFAFLHPAEARTEALPVNWVANRIPMPWAAAAARPSWLARFFAMRALPTLAIAMAALVITVGLGLRSRTTVFSAQDLLQSAERSQSIELIAPKGDLDKAPGELRWAAVAGAAQYKVKIMEVDHVLLWQATTASLMLPVPAGVQSKSLPGKRLIWQVEALDAGGREIAQSSQSFRKKPGSNH